MTVLVTGASGFIGQALVDKLLEQGERVISVSRHPPELRENMIPLVGDILKPNLGLDDGILHDVSKGDITRFYHVAGIPNLGRDRDGSLWMTNVDGTSNVISFCARHNIPHLLFTSTAYTKGRNPYERSKAFCETMLKESDILRVTIFKPSIVMGTEMHPSHGNFSQFVALEIKAHKRGEIIRRKIWGTLRLPVIEPVFRVRGNPDGKLNLIKVDDVAQAMANIKDTGTFWLTNPDPPKLQTLADWIGEFIMVKMIFMPEFKPTPIEWNFQRQASAFAPYLQGDDLPSNLQFALPINKAFIHDTIKRIL